MQDENFLQHSSLGKKVSYQSTYDPALLFPISRQSKRDEIGVTLPLPFYGFDVWNHYEVSWLNAKGKPVVMIAEISYDCSSPFIVESKSLKLYFNSLNQTRFQDTMSVKTLVMRDLSNCIGAPVTINFVSLHTVKSPLIEPNFAGICLDGLDVECDEYLVNPHLLTVSEHEVEEAVYSDLLKSNCLVTNQPDWGSVYIDYAGKQINHQGLLKYLVSFRLHNEFHEQCIERIFMDIMRHCQPNRLTVYGRYTRRGGLDINPLRTSDPSFAMLQNQRLIRQ